jgi:hypothetical protein
MKFTLKIHSQEMLRKHFILISACVIIISFRMLRAHWSWKWFWWWRLRRKFSLSLSLSLFLPYIHFVKQRNFFYSSSRLVFLFFYPFLAFSLSTLCFFFVCIHTILFYIQRTRDSYYSREETMGEKNLCLFILLLDSKNTSSTLHREWVREARQFTFHLLHSFIFFSLILLLHRLKALLFTLFLFHFYLSLIHSLTCTHSLSLFA